MMSSMVPEPSPGQVYTDSRTDESFTVLYEDSRRVLLENTDGYASITSRRLFESNVAAGRYEPNFETDSVEHTHVGDETTDGNSRSVQESEPTDGDGDTNSSERTGTTPIVLTESPGVGERGARSLLELGYESAEDIIEAGVGNLTPADGMGEGNSTALVEYAEQVRSGHTPVNVIELETGHTSVLFTGVPGVGSRGAHALRNAGIWSAEAVLATERGKLLELDGIGEKNCEALIDWCEELV